MIKTKAKHFFLNAGIRPQEKQNFSFLWLTGFLAYLGIGLTSPQFSVRVIEQGIPLKTYGIIQATATLLAIATQVSLGKLSDSTGWRRTLVLGAIFLLIPVVLLFPYAQTALTFTVLLSLNTMAISTMSANAATWVTELGQTKKMGRLHGLFRISYSCGWVAATALLGTALDRLGFNATFMLAAALILLSAVVLITKTKYTAAEKVPQEPVPTAAAEKYSWPPELKLVLLGTGLLLFANAMAIHLNYIFISQEMGASNQQFGLLASIQALPEIPLMLFFGYISDSVPTPLLLTLGMGILSLRWLAMGLVTRVAFLFFIQPLQAIAITISDVLIVATIARLVPSNQLGQIMGWRLTIANIAALLAPLAAGAIGDLLSIRAVFFLASFIILSVAAAITIHRRIK